MKRNKGVVLDADGTEEGTNGRKMKRTSCNCVCSFDHCMTIYNQINLGVKPFQVDHQC